MKVLGENLLLELFFRLFLVLLLNLTHKLFSSMKLILYDSIITDTLKGLKIAVPANTDFTDYQLVEYKGAGMTYSTTTLMSIVPD